MKEWQEVALKTLPGLQPEIEKAENPMSLWFEIVYAFDDAYDEEFSARELARIDLNSLRKRANLSSQEAELHEYLCRFPDAVTSDIADHLGVKADTAGVVKRNWRRKLRRAANLE